MAKYFGKVGYLQTEETVPGVFSEHIEERNYYGDILSNHIKPSETGEGLNDNLRLNHKISIVSDSFAMNNFGYMKYLIETRCSGALTKPYSAMVLEFETAS